METLFDLTGKVAFVTGASRGLGRAMAAGLARAGADVVVTSRKRDDVAAVARELGAAGRKALPLALEVTRAGDVEAAVHEAVARMGRIDILVNNAGINIRKPVLELTEDDWDRTLDTNLKGAFLVAKAVGRQMLQQGSGSVINVASMMASVVHAERAAYASSKAGVVQLTRVLAVEWAPRVRVNAICPGPFLTELNRPILNDAEKMKYFMDRLPMQRFGEPEELVGSVIFLASAASSYMTGTTLYIDGGWTAL
jgi:NAD(P)-dependent dehydrogenase (short-subunit alcohol dehydrogenase family)